ncbi:hypothetical protein [Streptomyces capillispiralis]|uniref:Uncharacterized protein n=1 Tax=Streptomyces capillispiralis TaxID=68182 RepID=A0A561T871_9ACTN|nr:hypothetical protein [Streptomyces capillispiralis]TWF83308.1 hypothetical protein FHX78_11233 [Streptomyces capillispiralis]GHH94227.1 hypothetical protein GCM10017779_46840 [Streptomyces capillispiralis]
MRRKEVRDDGEGDVEAALDELYALPPSGFVARREELAAAARTAGRADDARRIRAARRPTLAAWAANLLRRSRPDEAERFLELGRALREAHATLDPSGLKETSAQRRRIVSALSRQAAGLAREAGHPLSDTVQRDVETTLRAVLADPEAADLWAGGRVESTLTPPSGFPSDTPGTHAPAPKAPRPPARTPSTTARTPSATARRKDELAERRAERQRRLAQAREAAREAGDRLRERRTEHEDADAARERADEQVREARQRVSAAEDELREARAVLERAEREHGEAEERSRGTTDALARAERDEREAAREVERAAKGAR